MVFAALASPAVAQNITKCAISAGGSGFGMAMDQRCIRSNFGAETGPALQICPQANVQFGYRGNAFREPGGGPGDAFVTLNPSVEADTVGLRHDYGMRLGVTARRHLRRTNNDFVDFRARGTTKINATDQTAIEGMVDVRRGHDERASLDAAGTRGELAKFIRGRAGAGVTYERSDGFVSAGHTIEHRRFVSDPAGVAAGRDRTRFSAEGCVGRTLARRLGIVVNLQGTYTDRKKAENQDIGSDNYNVSLLGSVFYRFTDITQIQFGSGWLRSESFAEGANPSDTFLLKGNLRWQPTPLTRVSARISTGIKQTSIPGSEIAIERSQSLQIRHSPLRAVTVDAATGFTVADIQDSDAQARTWHAMFGGAYQVHPRASISANYRYTQRFGRGDQRGFVDNTVFLSFTYAY